MRSIFLSIAIIGAAMLAGCKNQAESNNPITVVIMDSQTPAMYQDPDTLDFIRQSIIKNGHWDSESVEEIKMYFGNEGSRKSMLYDLRCEINGAANLHEPLSKINIVWKNSNEELGEYCQKLEVLCDTLISNQRRILAILDEDYCKFNFYCVLTFKNKETWGYSGIITDGRCIVFGDDVLWDLNEMNR